jgi:hypothetical protein
MLNCASHTGHIRLQSRLVRDGRAKEPECVCWLQGMAPWPGVAKLFTLAQWLAPLALTGETQLRFLQVMSLSVPT